MHPFVANKARKITELVRSEANEIAKGTQLDGDADGGQVDAFRHSYWMACLSKVMRPQKALRLGRAHEKGNYLAFKKDDHEEGSIPDSMASVMDIFNNELGIGLATKYMEADTDTLRKLVINAIIQGEAKVLLKNSSGEFLDCEGNVLNISDFKGRWSISKCLVNSNSGIHRVK